ncbi:SRPBCC domain-containing protein [Bauldia sp.]|uniref:SRPBCC domain-containing protein n=1 Tax=Bauldia sp. TaxID=2575872 RepID=UPI003BABB5C4
MSDAIHQEVTFNATPSRVYAALMDSGEHATFTANGAAEISRDAGGAFSAHGGEIVGRNIELVPDRRIVQAWRVKHWPEGVYSVIRFELEDDNGGTRLVFDHWGAPEEQREHLAEGWKQRYWEPLQRYLG